MDYCASSLLLFSQNARQTWWRVLDKKRRLVDKRHHKGMAFSMSLRLYLAVAIRETCQLPLTAAENHMGGDFHIVALAGKDTLSPCVGYCMMYGCVCVCVCVRGICV